MMNNVLIRLVAAFVLLWVTGCSSGGSVDDDGFTPEYPITEQSGDNALSPVRSIANGYYLSSESLYYINDEFQNKKVYLLDNDKNTLSRYQESATGLVSIRVIHEFNEKGLITTRKNVDSDGAVTQSFLSSYDESNRLVSERSFNAEDPFLSTSYQFAESGAVIRKVVTSTVSGSAFSETDYRYSSSGVLLSTSTTSPLLTIPIVRNYSFSANGMQLEMVEDSYTAKLEYDINGNVSSESRFNSDGQFLSTTIYEYTETDLLVPNLTLHELTYSITQI